MNTDFSVDLLNPPDGNTAKRFINIFARSGKIYYQSPGYRETTYIEGHFQTALRQNKFIPEDIPSINEDINKFRKSIDAAMREVCDTKKEVHFEFIIDGWDKDESSICEILKRTNE